MSTNSPVRSHTPATEPRPEILVADEVSQPQPRDERQNRHPAREVKAFHVFCTFERHFGNVIAKAVSKGGTRVLTDDTVIIEAIKAGQDEARKIAYDLIHQQKEGGNRFTNSSRFLAKWGEVLRTFPQDVLPQKAERVMLEPFEKGVERLLKTCLASEEHRGKASQLLDEATRTGLLNAFAIAAYVAMVEKAK